MSQTDASTQPPDSRAWLNHIPAPRRGPISNWFRYAVRQGATTPALVLMAVRDTCMRRAGGRPQEVADAQVVLAALTADPGGALAYAQSVLDYEALPLEVRHRIKAERTVAYRAKGMVGKTVTEAQLGYLAGLGYRGPQPVDRAEASALIEQCKAARGRP